ncbi:hypothetical protein ACWGCW_29760 [Streptomyces sp. NPDC054933]
MTSRSQHLPSARGAVARFAPASAVWGFLVLLALLFAASYAVGMAAGPVAPGMHRMGGGTGGGGAGEGGMPGMAGMDGMGMR